MEDRYYYAWIRKDLNEAQRIIQTSHACYECALRLPKFDDGMPSSMVLFEVENQEELLEVSAFLYDNIPGQFHIFYEPDAPWDDLNSGPMGYTAIATRPFTGEERKLFSGFKLYGGKKKKLSVREKFAKWASGFHSV